MSGGKTVAELAQIAKGKLIRGDGSVRVMRVAPTDAATADAITFVSNPKYLPYLKTTEAAALLIAPEALDGTELPPHLAVIATASPYAAFARVAQALVDRVPQPEGVHPSAVIDRSASIGAGASIGPFVLVGLNASIGEGAVLHAGVHVEANASIGAGTILYNHAVVRHGCKVGSQCILHPGVVVGSDGFGFAQDGGEHVKIPQVGDVVIEDEVEIGANCCIDRGALGSTRIGAGTKIDNLVQIAHNVQIGERCIVVAQAGIAGSSKLGRSVILAAQAGVVGHVEIGDGARVLGQSGVMRSVPAGESMMGSPAVPQKEHFRTLIHIGKLDSLFKRVKKLERLLERSEAEEAVAGRDEE
jgi:UDP-3-O-[3-hydroxymyristoyl] glucosamine N-acyltransferase